MRKGDKGHRCGMDNKDEFHLEEEEHKDPKRENRGLYQILIANLAANYNTTPKFYFVG